MGYLHIPNLYDDQSVLMMKECYALEKIHGTSAHISHGIQNSKINMTFFSGGASHEQFCSLFDNDFLYGQFSKLGYSEITIYGEAYGGKEQGMKETYGPNLKFVVFDVEIDGVWSDVPHAESVAKSLGMEFIDYVKIPTDLTELNLQRDRFSVQAERNGIPGKLREGVILRPIVEMNKSSGARVIAKHKSDEFCERATPQKIIDPTKLKVLQDAEAIANEWVVPNRLKNILSHLKEEEIKAENTRKIISLMTEDVLREAGNGIVDSPDAKKAIGKKTAEIFQKYLKGKVNV